MAKRRGFGSTALATRPQGVVVVSQSPARRAPGRVRRAAGAARRGLKRGSVALAKGAWEEKIGVGAVVGAGLVGYADGAGMLESVPDIGFGKVPTVALGLYIGGRMFKSPKLRAAGIGLAAATAFAFGAEKGKASKKDK